MKGEVDFVMNMCDVNTLLVVNFGRWEFFAFIWFDVQLACNISEIRPKNITDSYLSVPFT
jgi:hypothetical protein